MNIMLSMNLFYLFSLSIVFLIYFFLNILNPDQGSQGLIILFVGFALSLPYIALRIMRMKTIYVRKSLFLLLMWFIYYALKIIYDLGIEELHTKLTNTTGGMLLFYVFGIVIAYIISGIFKSSKKVNTKLLNTLFLIFVVFFTICMFYLYFDLSQKVVMTYSGVRYYIPEYSRLYQRPANFMTIAFMIFSMIYIIVHFHNINKNNFFRKYITKIVFLIYIGNLFIGIYTMQLLGSNKIVPMLLIQLVLLMIIFLKFKKYTQYSEVNIFKKLLIKKTTINSLLKLITFFIVLLALLVIIDNIYELNLTKYRVFSVFNAEQGGSVASRFHIYHIFFDQFNYSPIFGTIDIKEMIGHKNTHSFILELLVNTGLVGFLILMSTMFFILKEVLNKKYMDNYRNVIALDFFLFMFFTGIFLLACISIGLTWIVLWFVVGLLSVDFK